MIFVVFAYIYSQKFRDIFVKYFLKVKLTFEMVAMCGKQHSFLDSRMDVLVRVSRFFETENVSTPGGVEPQPSDSCKVNIWSINCAQSTAFIWYSASIGVDLFHNRIINVCIEHLITYMRIFSACVLVCACGGGKGGGGGVIFVVVAYIYSKTCIDIFKAPVPTVWSNSDAY